MDVNGVVKELTRLQRERAVVRASSVPDAFKARLYAALDAREAELSSQLELPMASGPSEARVDPPQAAPASAAGVARKGQ